METLILNSCFLLNNKDNNDNNDNCSEEQFFKDRVGDLKLGF